MAIGSAMNSGHVDANQQFSLIGVMGSAGTADVKGTAFTLPISVREDSGAMYVYNLGPAGSTTVAPNLPVIAGTPADPGTPLVVRLTDGTSFYNAGATSVGTNNNIVSGTQQTLGTVGTILGIGGTVTVSGASAGTNVNIVTGTINSGTMVGNAASGAADSGNPVKLGGVFNGTQPTVTNGQRVDLQSDNRGNLKVYLATTLDSAVDSVTVGGGTIQSLLAGTVTSVGTILGIGGTVQVSGASAGTNVNIVTGTQQTLGTVGTVTGVGTITNLGSVTNVGTLKEVSNLAGGTVGGGVAAAGSWSGNPFVIAGTQSSGGANGTVRIWRIESDGIGNVYPIGGAGVKLQQRGTTFELLTQSTGGTLALGTMVGKAASGATASDNPVLIAGTDVGGTVYAPLVTSGGALTVTGASAGTFVNIVTGTQQTLGTVGVLNAGTLGLVTRIGNIGTIESGTVTTTLALNTGTLTTIAAGTQNTLGTVGTVTGIGTLTNLGTLTNVGSLTNIGTISQLPSKSFVGTINSNGQAIGSIDVSGVNTVSVLSVVGGGFDGGLNGQISSDGGTTWETIYGKSLEDSISFGNTVGIISPAARGPILYPVGGAKSFRIVEDGDYAAGSSIVTIFANTGNSGILLSEYANGKTITAPFLTAVGGLGTNNNMYVAGIDISTRSLKVTGTVQNLAAGTITALVAGTITTGTVTIQNTAGLFPGNGTLAESLVNPVTTMVGANLLGWNQATWDRIQTQGANGDSQSGTGALRNSPQLFVNETNYARQRGHSKLTYLSSASRAIGTNAQSDQANPNYLGIRVTTSVTVNNAGTLTVQVDGKTASGVYYALITSAVYAGLGTSSILLYPTAPNVANIGTADILPATYRIQAKQTAGTMTYAVDWDSII